MKNFGCVVILVLVLAILIVLLVPWLNAQACDPKPTPTAVPGQEDRDCKKGCVDAPRNKPNFTASPLPKIVRVPASDPPVYLPLVVRGMDTGAKLPYPYPAP
jgi:hypothetical protein